MRWQGDVNLAPRRVPAQSRAALTVDNILAATAQLLKQVGFERLTTNAVAELAGYSVGTLYHYFPCKEALIAELRRCHYRDTKKALNNAFDSLCGASLEDCLRQIVAANVMVHRKDPDLHYLLMERYPDVGFEVDMDEPRFSFNEPRSNPLENLLVRVGGTARPRAFIMARVGCQIIESVTHAATTGAGWQIDEDQLVDEIVNAVMGYFERDGAA